MTAKTDLKNTTKISNFVLATSLSELEKSGAMMVNLKERAVALFKVGTKVYAVDNRCPHMGFPLIKGTVSNGILTCHWHHARFDLETGGTFDQWADDVPSFPVEIRDGDIWVDVSPPRDHHAHYRRRLHDGLERNISLVIAKSIISLLEVGDSPVQPFKIGLEFGIRYRQSGWGQGLTILTCLQNMLPHLDPQDHPLALYHGLTAVASDTSGMAPRFVVKPLPGDPPSLPKLKNWFRQFIEVRDDEGAERCIVSAIRAGADHRQIADMLFAAATDHRYIQIGHPLDFTNKAFEALDLVGWDLAEPVLTSLVRGYAMANRMEESNSWRHPVDLVSMLETAFEDLPALFEEGNKNSLDTKEKRKDLLPVLLGDDPQAIVDALMDTLKQGCSPTDLAGIVAYAAAMRIAQFHTSNEFGDWDTALHTFTFANAVHQGLSRLQNSTNLFGYTHILRGVFDAAMSIYLDRFLNIPPARIPDIRIQLSQRDSKPNAADSSTRPQEEILNNITQLLDHQQQIDRAGEHVAQFFNSGGDPKELIQELGSLLLREDRDFHTIQAVEAAVRQFNWMKNTEDGAPVLIAAARYLAAHAPTMRAQGQTYRIAQRLSRGERVFVD